MNWAYNISFDPLSCIKYLLRISSKSTITTCQSSMHIFWGCYRNFSFLIKVVSSHTIVFRKCKCFSIRFWSRKKGIWPFPGAILTISLGDMFGPSTLYMTVGKGGEGSVNSLSLNSSLPSISSSLSVWSLLLDSLAFLSVFSSDVYITLGLTAHWNLLTHYQ